MLRNLFDTWRIETHSIYKQKQIELEPHYYQTRKTEIIDEWDSYIDKLKGYITQLQTEIKVEVNSKHELIKVYEASMNHSVKKFNEENHFVNTQVAEYRANTNFDDTLARGTIPDRRDTFGKSGTNYVPKTADIGHLTLLREQTDPEDEEDYVEDKQ